MSASELHRSRPGSRGVTAGAASVRFGFASRHPTGRGRPRVDPMDRIAIHEVFGIGEYLRQKKIPLAQIVAMQSISGCREAQPNRTGTSPVLTSKRSGLEQRNSLRSLAPYYYSFHASGGRHGHES